MGPCVRRDDHRENGSDIASAATIIGLPASILAVIRRDFHALPEGKDDEPN